MGFNSGFKGLRHKELNGWDIQSERTKQDRPESYQIGDLWKLDQQEDQDNDGKGCHGGSKKAENKKTGERERES